MGDVPAFCRDLVLSDPVFHRGVAKPRKLLEFGEQQIQLVGNLRCKLVEIAIPRIAVVGGGEEQLRVIVQEHKPHIVDGGYLLGAELASSACSRARSRIAPPGTNLKIRVSSETLP